MATAEPADSQAQRFEDLVATWDIDLYVTRCKAAWDADPENSRLMLHYIEAVGFTGRADDKLDLLHRLIAKHPKLVFPRISLGLELMTRGKYREAWPHYDFRKHNYKSKQLPAAAEWKGDSIEGKTILIVREQGLGDTIHFIRNVILLQRLGAKPALDIQQPLRPLLSRSPAIGQIMDTDEKVDAHTWVRMLDIVPLLTPTLDDVEWPGSYIAAPADAPFHSPFATARGLRVGLAWFGSPTFKMNAFRSVPLKDLAPLSDLEGCTFYSLMLPPTSDEIAELGFDRWLTDLSDVAKPFDRLAAAISQLDVVVTMCTSIAHLAGAMGKPVLLMLSQFGEWRWARERGDTPWYPSMQIFRQQKLGDWAPVVQEVRNALSRF